jgi:Flp pilus assembly protein TadD
MGTYAFGESAEARDAAWQRARVLAEAKRFGEALQAIEPYATATDYEARVLLAKLRAWNKDYTTAERLYRRVLFDDPANLEARLGLADTLAWTRRFKEALAVLPTPSSIAEPTDVLIRKARYEYWSGDLRSARTDFAELLRMTPSDHEAEAALTAISKHKSFQLDLGFATDDTSAAPRANAGTLAFTYRSARNWTLTTGIQPEQRFTDATTHYLIGASTLVGKTSLSAQYSWAAPTQFLSRSDFRADIIQRLSDYSIGAGYRQIMFSDATVHISEAIGYAQVTPAFLLETRLAPTYTTSLNAGSWRLSAVSRVTWQANRRASPFFAIALGNTTSGTIVNGKISHFATQTYTAGVTLQCTQVQAISATYFHEERTANVAANGVGLAYRLQF